MSSIKTTQIDGDVSIGRNLSMGGKANIQGSVHVGHNMRVDGWLEAPNIKGANKGIYLTIEELRSAYPNPHDGWLAGVGASTPFTAYVGKGGDWVASGGQIEINVDLSQYTEEVEQLRQDIIAVNGGLGSANAEIAELLNRIKGESENSSAYTDPFINMGNFDDWTALNTKLNNIDDTNLIKYMGRCRAKVSGVTIELYNFINNFRSKDYSQVILGNVSANANGDVTFTSDHFNIMHRQHKDGAWSAWQRINDHPLATPSLDGLMSAADKKKSDNYPAQFVMDFGLVDSQTVGEQMAARSEVAGNRNISFIRFQVNDDGALRTTLILQWPNGDDYTAQIKFTDKTEWRRNVRGATGVAGAATAATQWERTAPHYLGYDAATRKIQLKDYTQAVSGYVELPLATSSQPGLMSAADKEKSDNYPSKFVLDLGLVASQEAGEQEAAKSEVAGNRNISFIRFQVQGVSTLKTSLIMQWPNGVNETAQIMCVDKAQWRRNVTGATGVAGAPTNAYPWERTAPHFIDYDKSRRMLQLKDYFKKVVSNEGGVELPLATSTQDGLMSAEDKSALDTASAKVDTATRIMPFGGVVSNPTIEQVDILPIPDAIVFDDIRCRFLSRKGIKFYSSFLGSMDYNKTTNPEGTKARTDRIFFRTDTKSAYIFDGSKLSNLGISEDELAQLVLEIPVATDSNNGLMSAYHVELIEQLFEKAGQYADSFVDNPSADSGNISGKPSAGLMSAADKAKLENYPNYPFDIAPATEDSPGLMSAADKARSDNYPTQFVMDFGLVDSQAAGEQMAARSEVAGNRNISFIRFQVNGVRALRTSLILQWPNGINETAQLIFTDKAQYRRNVTGATGVAGAATTATDWERTAPHCIGYDAARRMIQLKDYTETTWKRGEVELPLATSSQHGLMSSADKAKITELESRISDIEAQLSAAAQ